jgi:hypothetical protein
VPPLRKLPIAATKIVAGVDTRIVSTEGFTSPRYRTIHHSSTSARQTEVGR